jgi:hypothetical protein
MTTVTVALPAIPKEQEFAEVIPALLQSSGYYIDGRVEEHEQGGRVMELAHHGT